MSVKVAPGNNLSQKAITWINDDIELCGPMVSPGPSINMD